MRLVRPPAVAGTFYPESNLTLSQDVLSMLSCAVTNSDGPTQQPKAVIVPHAGYVYSGSIAALAYSKLVPLRQTVRRVLLLGPVHRVPVRGLALPGTDFFTTPLGQIEIDQEAIAAIRLLPQIVVHAQAHAFEHSLEVQLPFLQTVLDDFKLLPLAVGDATAAEVAQVLDSLWGDKETLIVISSDLSHFLTYDTAQSVDQKTIQEIMNLQPYLTHKQACGATPVNGLLLAARQHHLHPELLGLCNSGDTTGDKTRVVGYAAVAFNSEANHAHG